VSIRLADIKTLFPGLPKTKFQVFQDSKNVFSRPVSSPSGVQGGAQEN